MESGLVGLLGLVRVLCKYPELSSPESKGQVMFRRQCCTAHSSPSSGSCAPCDPSSEVLPDPGVGRSHLDGSFGAELEPIPYSQHLARCVFAMTAAHCIKNPPLTKVEGGTNLGVNITILELF